MDASRRCVSRAEADNTGLAVQTQQPDDTTTLSARVTVNSVYQGDTQHYLLMDNDEVEGGRNT